MFRHLYAIDNYYEVISDGLIELESLDVDNLPDAIRELRNFCSRAHNPSTVSLCDYCSAVKTFLESNEEYPFSRLFNSVSSRFFGRGYHPYRP